LWLWSTPGHSKTPHDHGWGPALAGDATIRFP
jgi:hypothetical protein